MEIDTLRLFLETLERGSFAAVARDRDMDPSSVSRSIAGLETELGIRLLQRTTRRLALTEAGALYADRVRPLVEDLDRAQAEASDVLEAPKGTVRLSASVSFGQTCLMPLLPELRATYPELVLDLLLSDAMVDLIADRVDVAVRLVPRPDPGLIATKLMPTRYRVCASPGYLHREGPIETPADLASRPCLLFPLSGYRSLWRFRSRSGEEEDVPVAPGLIISNATALRDAARRGLGPVLLADWLVGEDFASGRLVDLLPQHDVTATDWETAAWLVYPSRDYVPRKVRVVIDFLKACLPRRVGA
jgi:DNA-binding transcriptional LysR family regulator